MFIAIFFFGIRRNKHFSALLTLFGNPSLASELFISLTKKLGYDKISACTFVPVIKTDYQAYLRKALKILDDMLLLKNMPADFPAEKYGETDFQK